MTPLNERRELLKLLVAGGVLGPTAAAALEEDQKLSTEITIPCGFSKGPPQLPISIQFYGRPFDEATILRVAHAYESATDWHRRRPVLV